MYLVFRTVAYHELYLYSLLQPNCVMIYFTHVFASMQLSGIFLNNITPTKSKIQFLYLNKEHNFQTFGKVNKAR